MTEFEVGQWVKGLIRAGQVHLFYVSKLWRELQRSVLAQATPAGGKYPECQLCKRAGRYSRADTVHHIKYLRHCPSLALTRSNLIAICSACHKEIHRHDHERAQLNGERW